MDRSTIFNARCKEDMEAVHANLGRIGTVIAANTVKEPGRGQGCSYILKRKVR
ncbi:MAG TPA: hypothetical protein VLH13_05755 [Methanomassiliicoccales archaeon]|nr:hypothetical protein [Methanomassiliicoccales archaeon]